MTDQPPAAAPRRPWFAIIIAAVLASCAVAVVWATTRAQTPAPQTSVPSPSALTPAAVVNGETITIADLESSLGTSLTKLEQDLYELKRDRLEAMISEKLLVEEAKKRGVDVNTLVKTEILDKTTPVTQQDVDAFFEANKARLPNNPDIKDQIKRYLENQKAQARRDEYVDILRKDAKVSVMLQGPPIRRAQLDIEGAPVRGATTAPVTIVEFSDFHCPFCKRVQPTLLELLAKYPGKVRLIYKDMPLESLHPQARKASEAARCARDQGKFWEYHDKIYQGGPDSSPEYLKKLATDVGLDTAAFEQCLASGKHLAGIETDLEQAQRLGLNGTPAFFVNGRALSGAQPFEAFAKVIEDELKPAAQ